MNIDAIKKMNTQLDEIKDVIKLADHNLIKNYLAPIFAQIMGIFMRLNPNIKYEFDLKVDKDRHYINIDLSVWKYDMHIIIAVIIKNDSVVFDETFRHFAIFIDANKQNLFSNSGINDRKAEIKDPKEDIDLCFKVFETAINSCLR